MEIRYEIAPLFSIGNATGQMWVNANPLGDFILKKELDTGFRHGYIESISGNIIFSGEDFERVKEHADKYRCETIPIKISKLCDGIWKQIFEGNIIPRKSEWDMELCTLSAVAEKDSAYKCLENNWEEEVNLTQTNMSLNFQTIDILQSFNRYRVHETYIHNTLAGQSFITRNTTVYLLTNAEDNYDSIISPTTGLFVGSNSSPNSLYNQIVNVADPQGGHQPVYRTTRTTIISNPPWIDERQEINSYYIVYEKDGIIIRVDPTYHLDTNTLDQDPTFIITEKYAFVGSDGFLDRLANSVNLKDLLEKFLEYTCSDLTIKSVFFNINFDDATVVPFDYPKIWNRLFINQKSDVKRPRDFMKSGRWEMSFKWLLESMCKMFNLWYKIDGNTLRIEHVSWGGWHQGAIDLREDIYNKFSFLDEPVPPNERFSFMEQFGNDFVGMPISYSGSCQTGDSDEKTELSLITTDLEAVLFANFNSYAYNFIEPIDPNLSTAERELEYQENLKRLKDDNIDDKGYVITEFTNTGITFLEGILDKPRMNNSLSWAHLHERFFKQNRYLSRGEMNGTTRTFTDIRKTKTFDPHQLKECCDGIDPKIKVNTKQGLAIIQNSELDFQNNILTINILA